FLPRSHSAALEARTSSDELGRKAHGAGEMGVARSPYLLVVGPGDDGHLVDPDTGPQLLDTRGNVGAGADEGVLAEALDACLIVGAECHGGGVGRQQRSQDSAVAVHARECARGEMVLRLLHRLGGERPDAEARMRLGMACAGAVALLVELDCPFPAR